MRPQDRVEAETIACGVPLRHFLHGLYRESVECRAALVDGEVAVVWGVLGPILASDARVWLFTSAAVERAPYAFFREVRLAVAAMLETRHTVVTTVTASYAQAIRFYEMVGFTAGPVYECGGGLVRDLTMRRRADAPPFIIYALPRSRTKWLSEFLSYKGWTCHHEAAIAMRSIEDVVRLFGAANTGAVETAAAHGAAILRHHLPGLKEVVVRRRLDDAVDAMLAVDVSGVATYDREALRAMLTRTARELDRISARHGVLTVEFDDLDREDVCRAIFEHCLPFAMAHGWWARLRDQNIQVDVRSVLTYFHRHREEIDGFKRACKTELRRLAYAGLVRKRAA